MSALLEEMSIRTYDGDTSDFEFHSNGGSFIVNGENGKRRCNGGDRGNSNDRRRRKQRLLDTFGDGKRCRCVHCNRWLTFATLTVDRIWPGAFGGTYAFSNCQPSCRRCNAQRGDRIHWKSPRWYGKRVQTA